MVVVAAYLDQDQDHRYLPEETTAAAKPIRPPHRDRDHPADPRRPVAPPSWVFAEKKNRKEIESAESGEN